MKYRIDMLIRSHDGESNYFIGQTKFDDPSSDLFQLAIKTSLSLIDGSRGDYLIIKKIEKEEK